MFKAILLSLLCLTLLVGQTSSSQLRGLKKPRVGGPKCPALSEILPEKLAKRSTMAERVNMITFAAWVPQAHVHQAALPWLLQLALEVMVGRLPWRESRNVPA